jgi:hypothetical protein
MVKPLKKWGRLGEAHIRSKRERTKSSVRLRCL